ncbi:Asp-tRNA(Asn)/Glu-tRNA(Gln) amidotransferase subunit GatC [Patescibacteria group bacterium]|nr:Asp-tRNA(Asn)/Glu-tRNA(Gln) amidotransferase subunit GatC [Patescibacteria group bacterium]
MAEIDKKNLKHLSELARIKISPEEESRLLKDFEGILDCFEELKKLNVSNVVPMTGGTNLKNVVREDEFNAVKDLGKGKEAFPETKDDYLKVPSIFK